MRQQHICENYVRIRLEQYHCTHCICYEQPADNIDYTLPHSAQRIFLFEQYEQLYICTRGKPTTEETAPPLKWSAHKVLVERQPKKPITSAMPCSCCQNETFRLSAPFPSARQAPSRASSPLCHAYAADGRELSASRTWRYLLRQQRARVSL
jgi:hypothetical protein